MSYNNKKPIIIGATLGLILSIVFCFTQDFDVMFYFTAAPLYFDNLILNSDGLVSIVTFIYFIAVFSLLGYILSLNLSKALKVFVIFAMIVIHLVLGHFGAKPIFDGFPEALGNSVSDNVN